MPAALDPEVETVAQAVLKLDPDGSRTAKVIRATLDQLYAGQRTGRYRWDQLHKTEKTHCGTLVEINMQREFFFDDGETLDFRIAGLEVDCKYSQRHGGWMIPIEARGEVLLVLTASDEDSAWSMGVVRAKEEWLTKGGNRDRKASLSIEGRRHIRWLYFEAELQPNILLHLPQDTVEAIMSPTSGQERINQLFRLAQRMRISRTVVETVAQQKDPMKRVRGNGGARSILAAEGIEILGQYKADQARAEHLGLPVPRNGEFVSYFKDESPDTDATTEPNPRDGRAE